MWRLAAMLVYRNYKIFLLCKLCEQIFFCFVHQFVGNANHLRPIVYVGYTSGAVYMEGDPRRRNNFSFALHAEISAEVLTK